MDLITWFNDGARRITNFIDLKLVVLMGFFMGLLIVKILPDIMNLDVAWYIVLFVIFAVRPLWLFFVRR